MCKRQLTSDIWHMKIETWLLWDEFFLNLTLFIYDICIWLWYLWYLQFHTNSEDLIEWRVLSCSMFCSWDGMNGPSLEKLTQNFHNLKENPFCNWFFLIQKAWAVGWGHDKWEDFGTETLENGKWSYLWARNSCLLRRVKLKIYSEPVTAFDTRRAKCKKKKKNLYWNITSFEIWIKSRRQLKMKNGRHFQGS